MIKKPFISFITFLSVIAAFSVFLNACNSSEIGNSSDVDPDTIYFDYKVWGEEGNSMATVMLQFRFAGSGGTTLVLEEPSKVELDGQSMPADSSRMTGAYYEVQKPVAAFAGDHSIVFTDVNGKTYQEDFSFQPFTLETTFPEEVKREDLSLELSAVENEDRIRVLMTDTSFGGDGINRLYKVENGRLLIPLDDLKGLDSGPINLELRKETDRKLKQATEEGGRISISYGLRREFMLKD